MIPPKLLPMLVSPIGRLVVITADDNSLSCATKVRVLTYLAHPEMSYPPSLTWGYDRDQRAESPP